MAPIKKIQAGPRVGTGASSSPTVPVGSLPAPNVAPRQTQAQTGKGAQAETAPTFNQNPGLAPKPADNGSTNVVQDQRMPGPKGPANVAQIFSGQSQQP